MLASQSLSRLSFVIRHVQQMNNILFAGHWAWLIQTALITTLPKPLRLIIKWAKKPRRVNEPRSLTMSPLIWPLTQPEFISNIQRCKHTKPICAYFKCKSSVMENRRPWRHSPKRPCSDPEVRESSVPPPWRANIPVKFTIIIRLRVFGEDLLIPI